MFLQMKEQREKALEMDFIRKNIKRLGLDPRVKEIHGMDDGDSDSDDYYDPPPKTLKPLKGKAKKSHY